MEPPLDPRKLLDQFLGPQASESVGRILGDFARPGAGSPPARREGPWSAPGAPAGGQHSAPSPLSAVTGMLGGGGGLAAGGLLAVMLGSRKARKLAGGALGYGAAAALGALAHRAWQNWDQGRNPAPVPASAPAQAAAPRAEPFELALVLAMIAAANADGHIDATEQKSIFDAVDRAGLAGDEKAFVFDALRRPPTARELAARADGPEQASQIWLAARIAIDPDHPSERAWLDELALEAGLPTELVAHLEAQVAGPAGLIAGR